MILGAQSQHDIMDSDGRGRRAVGVQRGRKSISGDYIIHSSTSQHSNHRGESTPGRRGTNKVPPLTPAGSDGGVCTGSCVCRHSCTPSFPKILGFHLHELRDETWRNCSCRWGRVRCTPTPPSAAAQHHRIRIICWCKHSQLADPPLLVHHLTLCKNKRQRARDDGRTGG